MVIYLNANGTIQQIYPEVVTQGSNSQSIVLLTNGISQGSAIAVNFVLPNGDKINGGLMIQQDSFVLNDEYVNAYTFDITKSLTNYNGHLKIAFEVVGGGLTTNSYEITIPIIKSIAPVIPTQPSDDEWYAQILAAYNYILQEVDVDIPADIDAAIAAHNTSGTAHADIRQKISDDISAHNSSETAHAYIRGLITALGERVTTNEGDISDLKTLTSGHTTEINNLKNGTTVIPTYELKANKITDWSGASNTTYPSAKLVKDTIDGISSAKAYVFDTHQHFLDWLDGDYTRTDGVLPSDLQIGNEILIQEQNKPDYWVSSISNPMTIADFTAYEGSVDLSNYLAKNNTTPFTPSGDYNPATKKYADDLVSGAKGDIDFVVFEGTVNNSTIEFELTNDYSSFEFENGKLYYIGLTLTGDQVLTDDMGISIEDKDGNTIELMTINQLSSVSAIVGNLRQAQHLDTNYSWLLPCYYVESGSPAQRFFYSTVIIKETVCSMTGDELLDAISGGTLNPNTCVVVTLASTDNDTTYTTGHIYRVDVTYTVGVGFSWATTEITASGGGGSVSIDNSSITENASNQIQAVGVIGTNGLLGADTIDTGLTIQIYEAND